MSNKTYAVPAPPSPADVHACTPAELLTAGRTLAALRDSGLRELASAQRRAILTTLLGLTYDDAVEDRKRIVAALRCAGRDGELIADYVVHHAPDPLLAEFWAGVHRELPGRGHA